MSRGNWGAIFAITALAVVSIGTGSFGTALHFSENQPHRTVFKLQPNTDQDHEERDIAAQEASAASAWWMVVISGLGLAVTTVGTILLYRQIKLTREAVEETGKATKAMMLQNDIAKDAIRPWLRLEPPLRATLRRITVGEVERWTNVIVDIRVRNFGQAPAVLPQADVLLFDQKGGFNRIEAQNKLFDAMKQRGFGSAPIYPSDSDNLGSNVLFCGDPEGILECELDDMLLMIGVRYLQPGRSEIFYVTTCFDITSEGYNKILFSEDSINVSLRHIKIMTEAT